MHETMKLLLLAAAFALLSNVRAGPKVQMDWLEPTVYTEDAWRHSQPFGTITVTRKSSTELVRRVSALAKLAPAGTLRTLLSHLNVPSVLSVLQAFRFLDAVPGSSVVPREVPPTAESLFVRLMSHENIGTLQGSALTGSVLEDWPEITYEHFSGQSGLAQIMKVLAPFIEAKTRELLAIAAKADVWTMVDTGVLGSHVNVRIHDATQMDHRRAPVVIGVARRLWLQIHLLRFFVKGTWARAPVLFALTGCASLLEPVNDALSRANLPTFADEDELYEWIRSMLTVVALAPLFVVCMDVLCRCGTVTGHIDTAVRTQWHYDLIGISALAGSPSCATSWSARSPRRKGTRPVDPRSNERSAATSSPCCSSSSFRLCTSSLAAETTHMGC